MDLLDVPLPTLTLRPDVQASEFFDRCEVIAKSCGYRIDRRRHYAGPEFDHLNLHLGQDDSAPMIRMVSTPSGRGQLALDVVTRWESRQLDYDGYLRVAKTAYKQLLSDYTEEYGVRLRLGVSRRPPSLDMDSVNPHTVSYALGKFQEAVRGMAVGAGDVRERLGSAWLTIHTVTPNDLPIPLRSHLEWIQKSLTKREARHRFEGTVDATLDQMQRRTGVKIAERILALTDALEELDRRCNQREVE